MILNILMPATQSVGAYRFAHALPSIRLYVCNLVCTTPPTQIKGL